MEDQHTFLDPPPPYRAHSNSAYYLSDNDSWPSSYYRNSPRVDLAKFYHDILEASAGNNSNNSSDEHNISECSQEVTNPNRDRRVTFSEEAPQVFEYEAEYDTPKQSVHGRSLDDGWPGRAKSAMKSSAFIDFKSKIEAKLSAVNDDSELISEIKNMDYQNGGGYYRYRKSPLVQRLSLRPIPNQNYCTDEDNELSSPCDSPPPETPKDNQHLEFHSRSSSTSSSSSSLSSIPNRMSWLRSFKLKSNTRSK
jgi:hypothetical protein